MLISMIVAQDQQGGIGFQNKLPWHLPADLAFFKSKTSGHHILMGRKTYESIGKPLPNRTSLVISRSQRIPHEQVHSFESLPEAIAFAESQQEEELFIIGGAEIYKTALPLVQKIYCTEVHHVFETDASIHLPLSEFTEISRVSMPADEKNKYAYAFVEYLRT
ncbi:MAG: dihydrofolate reductase [Cytophagaceae bacterium]|jgi:dihydrofolate reductase|nr:dihydrofolate reductase [Cytophagaceae bacterium]